MVPIDKITRDPTQPRKIFSKEGIEELSESIKEHGVIKNIEVDDKYQIISGENRWRAAKRAGLKEIPCRIIELTEVEKPKRQLHENIHHIPMNPVDIGKAIHEVNKQSGGKMTGEELAKVFGKKRKWATDHMSIADMPNFFQEAMNDGKLTVGSIQVLRSIFKKERVGVLKKGSFDRVVNKILKEELTLNAIRDLASGIANSPEHLDKFLKLPLKGKLTTEVRFLIEGISPSLASAAIHGKISQDKFLSMVRSCKNRIYSLPYADVGIRRGEIKKEIISLEKVITHWLKEAN